jgi:hypothetical protein
VRVTSVPSRKPVPRAPQRTDFETSAGWEKPRERQRSTKVPCCCTIAGASSLGSKATEALR